MKKSAQLEQKEIMDNIHGLVQGTDISAEEREILQKALTAIEKGGGFESHMVDLRNWLLPLVVGKTITPKTLEFYKELRADRKIGLGQGDSLLTGLAQEPFC